MSYFGPDLSTVDPNPTVYNYGETQPADEFSQVANTVGQWGSVIASIVSGNPTQSVIGPNGVQTVGARGSSVYAPSGVGIGLSGNTLLLLLVGGVVIFLLMKR